MTTTGPAAGPLVTMLGVVEDEERAALVGRRLSALFDNVRRADGQRWRLVDVSERTGIHMGHLSRMRSGRTPDNKMSTLESIADVFDVPASYWLVSDAVADGMIRARVAGQQFDEGSAVEQALRKAVDKVSDERAAARARTQKRSDEIESAIADFLGSLDEDLGEDQ